MKVLIISAVLFITIFSNISAEIEDDFLEDESFEAEDIIPFLENEQARSCIPKHEECTNDKHNCCRKGLFKLKCQCSTFDDESGQPTERCACGRPMGHQAIETGLNIFRGLFKGKKKNKKTKG
uniref:Toxin 1 isoform b n=1 Tax=Cupiennius salei TaxID=6928 RepID=A0A4Y5UGI1_CUPSA|nr:toxin 1 isoform b precursor [Cupiennius salei]